jgi:nitroreductase
MSVFDTIRTVLAVRSYRPDPIPEDAIRRIVEAARMSASARNRQPWHFIVVDDAKILAEIGGLSKTGPYIAGAPLAVVVAVERESRWAIADASRAIQSMVLTAWDQGIGSNWVGFGGMEEIGSLLDVPASLDVFAVIPFGYPIEAIGKGEKERKPLGEVVSHGRFGLPFA